MSEGGQELRVGIFVTAAVLIGGIFVFVIGNRSAMFASRVAFTTHFDTVDGLRPGSPVRIAGIDVGTVEEVAFDSDGRIAVTFEVRRDSAMHIRQPVAADEENGVEATPGSVCTVGSKGLLGDQLVDITVGTGLPYPIEGERPAEIPSATHSMLTSMLGPAGEDAESTVGNLNRITDSLAETIDNEQTEQDLQDIIHNLAEISRMAREEDGTVRRLLDDPEMANDVQTALSSLSETSSELNRTVSGVRRIITEVERGDGTAHEIIYGNEGVSLLASLALAAGEIATILRDVRTGDNNANTLLYGDGAGDLITNLTAMSVDLREIVTDVRAGRGTIGGLLVDPSIYEDIKRLVGNLQRNEILRSLVRYSIREDRARPPVPRPEERPADGE